MLVFFLYFIGSISVYFFNWQFLSNSFGFVYFFISLLNFLFTNTQLVFGIVAMFSRSNIGLSCVLCAALIFDRRFVWNFTSMAQPWIAGLVYGLNTLHPLLFYLTLMLIFYLFFFRKKILITFPTVVILYALVALILGMHWGSINAGWGFFWSNDAIEYILVAFILILAYTFHAVLHFSKLWVKEFIYLLIIFSIFLIRFNLFFSVHSFFINPQVKSVVLSLVNFFFIIIPRYSSLYCLTVLFSSVVIYWLLGFTLSSTYTFLFKRIYLYYLHASFFIVVYCLSFNLYYYGVLDVFYVPNFLFSMLETSLVWSFVDYLMGDSLAQNNYIALNLYANVLNSGFYYLVFYYKYLYYMGFYYYILFYILISLYKIYSK